MRILIIEDDRLTGEYLMKGLTEAGYHSELAISGKDGLYLALDNEYDAVILDVMLPDLDGWQVIDMLRRAKPVPVLFLTARDAVSDRIRGLELGAEDYLIKPFSFTELMLRLKNLLRKVPHRELDSYHISDLSIDVLRRSVERGGKDIVLTAKEFALLHLLAERRGEVLTRSVIASTVWGINFDSDTNVVDVAVKRLRDKIDRDFSNKLIHTLRGVGYILEDRQ